MKSQRLYTIKYKEQLKAALAKEEFDTILTFKYGAGTGPEHARAIIEQWVWQDTQIKNLIFVTERNRDNPLHVHSHVLIDSTNSDSSVLIIRRKVGHIGRVWSQDIITKVGSLDYIMKYVGWNDPGFPETDWGILKREN